MRKLVESTPSGAVVFRLDWYSRMVLTVIAVCLVALLTRPLWGSRSAGAASGALDVNIAAVGGWAITGSTGGALPVKVK